MERSKGYLILDNEKIIREEKCSISSFWFLINGKEYMCKMVGDEYFCYVELFYQYVSLALGIPTVRYDLAKFSSVIGVLTETYNPQHYKEISLESILSLFYNEVIVNNQEFFPREIFLENTQNLEDIWLAFLYYYRNRLEKTEIVKHLMKEVVDSFILQICTGDIDKHYNNLFLLDCDKPVLALNFDYGWCGQVDFYSKCSYNLQVFPLTFSNLNDARTTILDFLNYSSDEFVFYFISKVNLMPSVGKIFEKIENQTGVEVPLYVREMLIAGYGPLKHQILGITDSFVRKRKIFL